MKTIFIEGSLAIKLDYETFMTKVISLDFSLQHGNDLFYFLNLFEEEILWLITSSLQQIYFIEKRLSESICTDNTSKSYSAHNISVFALP